jgi:hypothetical protein
MSQSTRCIHAPPHSYENNACTPPNQRTHIHPTSKLREIGSTQFRTFLRTTDKYDLEVHNKCKQR